MKTKWKKMPRSSKRLIPITEHNVCNVIIGRADPNRKNNSADTPWDRPPSPGIVVKKGTITKIYPGSVIHLRSLVVEAGGILEITDGINRFTCIKVAGDCGIAGLVRARRHRSVGKDWSETAPDGSVLEVFSAESNLGGDGGTGSSAIFPGACHAPGGNGANGTGEFGGGGGGGAGYRTQDAKSCTQGGEANGIQGGNGGGDFSIGGKGGRGGRRKPMANGGYVYIRVEGKLDVTGGIFDFQGEAGDTGEDGHTGKNSGKWTGGGGGGGPGGQGGTLYLRAPDLAGQLTANLDGGIGGVGGRAVGTGSTPGRQGEGGIAGRVQFL